MPGANGVRQDGDGLLFEGSVSSRATLGQPGGSGSGTGGIQELWWSSVYCGIMVTTAAGADELRIPFEVWDA